MVDLPKKKVGIVACSGEELPEGTITRLAALKVLEQLRPSDTVTICLPLFLAGGEGDRAFARFYPTIAVDGCELRCAARATEMYSGKPAVSIMVTELIKQNRMEKPQGARRLNPASLQVVDFIAERITEKVDDLLEQKWSRRTRNFVQVDPSLVVAVLPQEPVDAACACGSGIPVRKVMIGGQQVTIIALPLIFDQYRLAGKETLDGTAQELLETVKIYNPIPAEAEEMYAEALIHEYLLYCSEKETAQ